MHTSGFNIEETLDSYYKQFVIHFFVVALI